MKLRTKILMLLALIAFSLLSVSFVGLQVLKSASETDNFSRIEQIFKSAYATISELEKMAQSGQLPEQEAKNIAKALLQENKYHDSEYVYVTDEKLTFIAAPHDPQLHGTSFNDFKDAEGNSIGQIVARVASQSPNKMVTYDWTSERDGEVVGLKSVAQKSKVWGWYIGTGISFKETDERYWSTAIWLLLFALALVVVIGTLIFNFGQSLTRSLGAEVKEVVNIVERISNGNLSGSNLSTNLDKSGIAGSLSYMRAALSDVVQEIQNVSDALTEQVSMSEQESTKLDKLTSELDNDSHAASGKIDEITAGLTSANEDIKAATDKLIGAEVIGKKAFELTNNSVISIKELEQNINSAGQSVGELVSEVNQIEGVLSVIQGVAEQTNLLALNAAIEAARAGEQGRGFAVVADEVRGLAKRTQDSTEEIHQMIDRLQKTANQATSSVSSSMETCKDVVDQSTEVSEMITEVLTWLTDASAMSNDIANNSMQHLESSHEVNDRVQAISEMSQQTAMVAKQAHQKSSLLIKYANSLKVETGKFTLDE